MLKEIKRGVLSTTCLTTAFIIDGLVNRRARKLANRGGRPDAKSCADEASSAPRGSEFEPRTDSTTFYLDANGSPTGYATTSSTASNQPS